MAGLRGPRSEMAEPCWAIARCILPDFVIPKLSLKANSPIESNANRCMRSLTMTGWEPNPAITCSRVEICRRIRGR